MTTSHAQPATARRADEVVATLAASAAAATHARVAVADDGAIVAANDACRRLLGYRTEQLLARTISDLVAPDEQDDAKAKGNALLAGARQDSLGGRRDFIHRDGHRVATHTFTTLVRNSADGPAVWVLGIVPVDESDEATDAPDDNDPAVAPTHAEKALSSASRRLQLLHHVASVAHEADSLAEAAPTILAAVCRAFAYPSGALLRRAGATLDATDTYGTATWASHLDLPADTDRCDTGRSDTGPSDTATVAPVATDRATIVTARTGERVCLTWIDRDAGIALAFHIGDSPDPAVPTDLLEVIAGDCGRVLERERTARALREREERFRAVFDGSPLAMGIVDDTLIYTAINGAGCRLLGYRREELIGHPVRTIMHPDDVDVARTVLDAASSSATRTASCEMRLVAADGREIPVINTVTWVGSADGETMLLGQMEDLTAKREAERALRRQAETDALTGLANRVGLVRSLNAMTRDVGSVAVSLGVDGFAVVNHQYGYEAGDDILATLAARLQRLVNDDDVVARSAGDQFVVIHRIDDGSDPQTVAATCANKIQRELSVPIDTATGSVHLTASIGLAYGAPDQVPPFDLFQRADLAMTQAKSDGKDRHVAYTSHLGEHSSRRQKATALLRRALDEDRFVLHYQPIVTSSNGEIDGFEALLRLADHDGRLTFPDEFIPEAERSGLIVPIGAWVLREACLRIATLRQATGRDLQVSVNVAARQAVRADLTDAVDTALADSGLPPDALTLEITESALLEAGDDTIGRLSALRDRGIRIALDDFGTGYSSLTYLRHLPVTCLKVDKSFVLGMTTTHDDAAIVAAVIGLARALDLDWVAEGVETRDHWEALRGFGAGLAQGYLFAKPLPGEGLEQVLAAGPRGPRPAPTDGPV